MKSKQYRTVMRAVTLPILLLFSLCPLLRGEEKQEDAVSAPIHERIEWTDIWVTNANSNKLPRVLFVGDSIVRGYFSPTEKELSGKANCARYTTSAFLAHQDYLDGLKVMLKRYQFDIIHINNGLHGWGYTEEQYKAAFPGLITLLNDHASTATIIWATTTPVRQRGKLSKLDEDKTTRVRLRNKIAAEFTKQQQYKTSDLFTLAVDHPDYHSNDGVHFSQTGKAAQAKYIATIVSDVLKQHKSQSK